MGAMSGNSSNSTPAWLADCAVLEVAECISRPACGFCFTTFTCMPGNADGPAVGAVRSLAQPATRIENSELTPARAALSQLPCPRNDYVPRTSFYDPWDPKKEAPYGWLASNSSWAYDAKKVAEYVRAFDKNQFVDQKNVPFMCESAHPAPERCRVREPSVRAK